MSINKAYFEEIMNVCLDILNNLEIEDKEFRIKNIQRVYNKMLIDEEPDREFYSLMHEIKSYEFINKFGKAVLKNDEKHEEGPDIKFGNNQIECVCCSMGEILNDGYKDCSINYLTQNSAIIDYNETKKYLLPRITSSLKDKEEKINNYIDKNIIEKDESTIIFIHLGELNIDFFPGKYGIELLEVLIGKGDLALTFDRNITKYTNAFFTEIDVILKKKKERVITISSKFFDSKNKNISGILFSKANPTEKYNLENTFMFINPYAINQLQMKDFKNIIYWKLNTRKEYVPMKNGINRSKDIQYKLI